MSGSGGGGDGRRQDVITNRALEGPTCDVYEKKQCQFGHLVSLEMIILSYTMIFGRISCIVAAALYSPSLVGIIISR